MTYSMLSMASGQPGALLNATLLEALAKTTFSTFFQHYVSSNVSMSTGSWAYQSVTDNKPDYL
jgi:hypothetical protein